MDIERELVTLRRRIARIQRALAGVVIGAMALVSCGAHPAKPATQSPDAARRPSSLQELTVERLNVREPDGTLRLVLSNKARAPDAIIDGKPVTGRAGGNAAGLTFYDENGNESGGLMYGGRVREGSGSWLAFDRHDQDQTLGLGYSEGAEGRYESGMYIWDRPEATLGELIPKFAALKALPAGPERDALIAEMTDSQAFERRRAFVGRNEEGTAVVELDDPQARTRLRIVVGADGAPRIEFLDEDGAVTYALTSDGPEATHSRP